MSNIPCKDCITFAICNAQMTDGCPFEDVVHKLIPKCSLIKKYTESHKYYFSSNLIIKVAKLFKPKASFIRYSKSVLVNSSSHIIPYI